MTSNEKDKRQRPTRGRYETPRVEESAKFETLAAGCTQAAGQNATCDYGVPSTS